MTSFENVFEDAQELLYNLQPFMFQAHTVLSAHLSEWTVRLI